VPITQLISRGLRKAPVVAGSMKNKAQAASGRVMPETAKAATQARQTAPGSGDQQH
jgi:hypothetical protein